MQYLEKMVFVILILKIFTNSFQLVAMEIPSQKHIFDFDLAHRALLKAAYDGNENAVDEIMNDAGNRAWELIITPVSNNCGNSDLPKNEYGLTAIHWAAREGHEKIITLFLAWAVVNKKCWNLISQQDDSGRTALHIAVIYDQKKIVQQLLAFAQKHQCLEGFISIKTVIGRVASYFAKDPVIIEKFKSFKAALIV